MESAVFRFRHAAIRDNSKGRLRGPCYLERRPPAPLTPRQVDPRQPVRRCEELFEPREVRGRSPEGTLALALLVPAFLAPSDAAY